MNNTLDALGAAAIGRRCASLNGRLDLPNAGCGLPRLQERFRTGWVGWVRVGNLRCTPIALRTAMLRGPQPAKICATTAVSHLSIPMQQPARGKSAKDAAASPVPMGPAQRRGTVASPGNPIETADGAPALLSDFRQLIGPPASGWCRWPPIGLILCASAGGEQVELLQLDAKLIRVGECHTLVCDRPKSVALPLSPDDGQPPSCQHGPMRASSSSFLSSADGTEVVTYSWVDVAGKPAGVVQIAHGLAEHGERYDRFAKALNAAGFLVHAVDHRGHGRTANGRLGDFGPAGFGGLIADVAQFGAALRMQHGELPLFLFGHSMGSFAAQAAILDHAATWSGVVLSGSTALDMLAAGMANAPADAPTGLEAFNAGFVHRTGYEWLSRDASEVDAYVADPWCGWDIPDDVIPSLFAPAPRLADPALLAGIRSGLAILIASGDADPLAGGGALVQLLGQRYREAGIADVTVTLYPGGRHEILNESNRGEVTADTVAWLRAHAAQPQRPS